LATTAYVKSNLATYLDLASFQTISASKLFNRGLSVAYNTGDGAVKVLPNTTSTSASSISFFRYYAQTTTNAGDVWTMGQNAFSAGAGNFAIGNNSVTALTINSNGSITANSGSITVPNGSITANGATFTGTAIAPTQIATDNSTNIATTAYVQSNLSIYQTIANMASYLLSATASTTYQTIAGVQLPYNRRSQHNLPAQSVDKRKYKCRRHCCIYKRDLCLNELVGVPHHGERTLYDCLRTDGIDHTVRLFCPNEKLHWVHELQRP
jgi:hypothetical protein